MPDRKIKFASNNCNICITCITCKTYIYAVYFKSINRIAEQGPTGLIRKITTVIFLIFCILRKSVTTQPPR
jgi:hypothetical protein